MKSVFLTFLVIILPIIANAKFDSTEGAFAKFVEQFEKNYKDDTERLYRFQIFSEKFDKINRHNKRFNFGLETYQQGVSQFTDWTDDELKAKFKPIAKYPNRLKRQANSVKTSTVTVPKNWLQIAPQSLDLRVSSITVKDQKSCGSSWAFSAIDLFQYKLYKTTKKTYDLSEQMCVDCARSNGCSGGWPGECLSYIKSNGVYFDTVYNYTGKSGKCLNKTKITASTGIPATSARKWAYIPANETLIAYLLQQYGWVSVSINAGLLGFYKSGVIAKATCPKGPNHVVTIVGYGVDTVTKLKYWLIKNNWSANWGDAGYFKLERDANACDIANPYVQYRSYLI